MPHERHVVSAHRTPVWMAEFADGRRGARRRSDHRRRRRRGAPAGHGGRAHGGAGAGRARAERRAAGARLAAVDRADAGRRARRRRSPSARPAPPTRACWPCRFSSNSRPDLRAKLRAFRDEQTQKVRAGTAAVSRDDRAGLPVARACSAAASWGACSPSPRGGWATASTRSRPTPTRPPDRSPTSRWRPPTTISTRCARSRAASTW